jgi:hypothetical protein
LKYNVYDLKQQPSGATVVVTLSGSAANVRLMSATDYSAYKAGRRHHYIGGLARKSPVNLRIPRSGHWYLTVDMAGLRGTVRSGVRIEPPALPPIRNTATGNPLFAIRHVDPDVAAADPEQVWDVFISHASEDKDSVAAPLALALQEAGLKVWVDHLELKVGDSLRRRIDHGISRSRFAVVVLSEAFFSKGWPQYELDGIVTLSVAGEQNMLPIWHEVDADAVRSHSASLADKVALSTSKLSVTEIAHEIASVVTPVGVV